MAKFLLGFFGGLSILAGFITITAGILTENGYALTVSLWVGGSFLLAGAPLLGFARVITLLEQIESNSRRSAHVLGIQNERLVHGKAFPEPVPPSPSSATVPW